ncbi:MAG TPA: hypothetical protein VJR94_11755 [Candidatus Nitrosocosmicus sp.]|nr:hypothetical protein [Candidatus Nitrosocosmicus sp.]
MGILIVVIFVEGLVIRRYVVASNNVLLRSRGKVWYRSLMKKEGMVVSCSGVDIAAR